VRKVNLDDGTVTNLAYAYSGAELGPWDLAVAGNGLAFFTTGYSGSGATVPLHQIDLATDTLSTRMQVFPTALLTHGADASLLFGIEPTASKGPIFTYDASTDSFNNSQVGGFNNSLSAVNRDGTLIAMRLGGGVSILDRDLGIVRSLSNLNGAVAFDPNSKILYAASSTANQVIAFDTNTWDELYRVDIGESLGGTGPFGNGEMQVSDDSSLLFVSTPTGVRVLTLGTGGASPRVERGSAPARVPVIGTDVTMLANHAAILPMVVPANGNGSSIDLSGSALTEQGRRSFSAPIDVTQRMPMARGKTARRFGDIIKGVIGGVDDSGTLLPGE
jgi:hypothetical protein